MSLFHLSDFLLRQGIEPSKTKLARHDRRGVVAWSRGQQAFREFVADQKKGLFQGSDFVINFLPRNPNRAVFVCGHAIVAEDPHPEHGDRSIYNLQDMAEISEYSGRIIIEWGAGTRSWVQWARPGTKPIIELLEHPEKPPFPGFSKFAAELDEIPYLHATWLSALSAVGGVYLLVCPETGEQYVGVAYGAGGIIGRWQSYVENGHGGNAKLKARKRTQYKLAILEIFSLDTPFTEAIEREIAWKLKLGSRAHGLNSN